MGKIYDNNLKSKHGPFGELQTQQGPYGGKDADNLTNKMATSILPPGDNKSRPK
ncbi:hypothetical protein [Sporomusa sp.]|jgi:hypothetical protein|uniref:hypothetical protein n=1 Tax=Sporomusa sp. TaxID=2078658 RepID=UPI002BEA2671|nr:hypothetical protein [Sporomusa sp.]HWR07176.1 hypothetical protein [Sporomusa sp.]